MCKAACNDHPASWRGHNGPKLEWLITSRHGWVEIWGDGVKPVYDCWFGAGQYALYSSNSGQVLQVDAAAEARSTLLAMDTNPATGILEVVGQVDVAVSVEQRKQI